MRKQNPTGIYGITLQMRSYKGFAMHSLIVCDESLGFENDHRYWPAYWQE